MYTYIRCCKYLELIFPVNSYTFPYTSHMKKLFSYIDYRLYLSDYYQEMKENTRYFSYRWFAQKADISSPAFLKRVIDGDRNLTQNTVEKFIIGLGLENKEAEYFRILVAYNQAKTSVEKQKNYSQMLSMADFVKNHQLSADQYRYFEHWYSPVIRELVCMHDFQDNFSQLASLLSPPINTHQARTSVKLLERLELIKKDESGIYKQTNPAVTSGTGQSDILKMVRLSFHQQVIQLASDALENLPREDRHAVGITMGISRSCYDVIVQEMEQFRQRIVTIIDNDTDSEQVFQMNMQVFKVGEAPDTKSKTGENDE